MTELSLMIGTNPILWIIAAIPIFFWLLEKNKEE
tara:strand:+ start:264 stop:365 length:102 start_codon:yes stop_codon:yes gene_type:complete